MPHRRPVLATLAIAATASLAACIGAAELSIEPWPTADAKPPFPANNPPTAMKIALGQRLFYDGDLSWNGTMSCATCHEQKRGFTDPNKTRPGFDNSPGERNIQTLANVGWFRSLTWGGPQVDTLEHQALIPIDGLVPVEMGFSGRADAMLPQRLKDQACYPELFRAAFPERDGEISMDTIAMALATFQRSLVSLDAAYDRYRRGDAKAISDQAKRGEMLFHDKQCASCHAGPHFTEAALPRIKPADTFHMLASPLPGKDSGLQRITLKEEDAGKFRTPGLRNVALSAPYMHDGEVATLSDAIRHHYAASDTQTDLRLKQVISGAEVADLVAFLETLTDQSFIENPAFALPKPGCPLATDGELVAQEDNSTKLHNSPQ